MPIFKYCTDHHKLGEMNPKEQKEWRDQWEISFKVLEKLDRVAIVFFLFWNVNIFTS